ncbi:MAG TPA: class I SAM-dependent methyltransferase [Phycisphaerales bacterium]|nr:class I SAM-dependent methyltransferase [Phycisphaerales bacterium]
MRQVVKDFAAIVSQTLPVTEPVYEFGALRVAGQEEFADLRPLFAGKEYVGADMREGLGVDKVLDLHTIDLPDESVGTVLCLDTLEHVEYPHTAMREIHRILKPDGLAVISSVMLFRIHAYPYDYWRFTPEAFRSLLKPFTSAFAGYAGEESFPHTVVGIGFKGTSLSLSEFEDKYTRWQKRYYRCRDMSLFRRVRKLITPPLFSSSSRKALGL